MATVTKILRCRKLHTMGPHNIPVHCVNYNGHSSYCIVFWHSAWWCVPQDGYDKGGGRMRIIDMDEGREHGLDQVPRARVEEPVEYPTGRPVEREGGLAESGRGSDSDPGDCNDRPQHDPSPTARLDIHRGPAVQAEDLRSKLASDVRDGSPFKGYQGPATRSLRHVAEFELISVAIKHAESRHGKFPSSLQRGLVLMAEEFGEVAKDIADYTRAHHNIRRTAPPIEHIVEEVAQLAGLCIVMLENISEGRYCE